MPSPRSACVLSGPFQFQSSAHKSFRQTHCFGSRLAFATMISAKFLIWIWAIAGLGFCFGEDQAGSVISQSDDKEFAAAMLADAPKCNGRYSLNGRYDSDCQKCID